MKSMPKSNLSKAEKEAVCREANALIEQYTEKNFKVALVVLIKYYGFGKKRIADFMDKYNAEMEQFKSYDKDGVFDYMFAEIYEHTGLKSEEFVSEYIPYKEKIRRQKVKPVSVVEAEKIQNQLKAMNKILKETLKDGE